MSGPERRLAELLEDGTRDDVLAFCRAERSGALAKLALKGMRRVESEWVETQSGDGMFLSRESGWSRRRTNHRAAVFALASAKDVLASGVWPTNNEHGDDFAVMQERGRAWCQQFADARIAEHPNRIREVREMVSRRMCDAPAHDNFLLGHISWLQHQDGEGRLAETLRRHSDFLARDLWRLFEIDGQSDCNLAGADKYSSATKNWSDALRELAADGTLPRDRLLDASLAALERDFLPTRAGWFSRFHEQLAPTLDERERLVSRYLSLLASSVAPTVAFALKALAKLGKAGRLPVAPLLDAVGPALHAKAKATVNLALRLLSDARRRAPELGASIAATATLALSHETADVQRRALELLRAVHPEPGAADDALLEDVRAAAELTHPSVRAELVAWLGAEPGDAPCDEAPDEHALPRGLPNDAVVPIATPAELLLAWAAAVEAPQDAIAVERVLDGVARLCDRTLDLSALARRSRALLERFVDPRAEDPVQRNLARLAIAYAEGATFEPYAYDAERFDGPSTARLFAMRCEEIAARRARPHQPLCTPTDARGWIAAPVLVDRALDAVAPDPADQVLALLRLAPNARTAALRERLAGCTGEFAAALRHALGSDGEQVGGSPALWAAAARARSPADDDARVAARHPDLGPAGAVAARCELSRAGRQPSLISTPPPPKQIPTLCPTVLFHTDVRGKYGHRNATGQTESLVRWSALIAPGCTEDYFAHAFGRLDVDWSEAQWEVRRYFTPMLHADCDLGPNAHRLLALGLAAKESGQWGMAVDCTLTAIGDGRLRPELLGAAFAELLTSGYVLTGRWARSLGEVARAGPRAAADVRDAIERGLRGDPARAPKDLSKLLELLHELCVSTDSRIRDASARAFLESVSGGGKVGKARRALLNR